MDELRIGEELMAGPDRQFNSDMAIVKRLSSIIFTLRVIAVLLSAIAVAVWL